MYSFVIVGSLLLFVISERTFLHFSRTARRAFWYVLSCAVGVWLVKWLQNVEGVGMVWIFLSAVLAASVVEDEVAKKTGLTPLNIEATQRVRAACRTPEAQGRSERIMDIVGSITRGKGYTAGTKQLVSHVSGTTRRLQLSLHSILSAASQKELNYILCAVNMAATIEVMSNHTMDMLVFEKLPLLCTEARAALVDGLQKLGLRYRPQRQAWAREVILHTTGINLTHFKAYIDDGGDYHSMYKLVYNDLQGIERRKVLQHLQVEGAVVLEKAQQFALGGPPGAVLKILSDIDDTVFSSGASFPAGLDSRYPRKCYYPGVLALYAAVDRCFAKKSAALIHALGGAQFGSMEEATEEPAVPFPETEQELGTEGSSGVSSTFPARMREATPPIPLPQNNMFRSSSMLSTGASPPTHFPLRPLPADVMSARDRASLFEDALSPRVVGAQPMISPAQGLAHHQEGSNLVFLSARPESYKGYTESESYRKYFQPLVMRGDLDTSPMMLLGSLDSGPRALMKLFRGDWLPDDSNPKTATAALYQTLAAKKASRFREYAAIYPEAAFVYMGDNGQGDVVCAEVLESSAKAAAASRPSQLLASFIHQVVKPEATLSTLRTSSSTREVLLDAWQKRHIYFYRSHVGMAAKAYDMGLLDQEGLHQVTAAAACDFRRIWSRYAGRHAGRNLAKAAKHLNRDIALANSKLPVSLQVGMVNAPEADAKLLATREASVQLSEMPDMAPMH